MDLGTLTIKKAPKQIRQKFASYAKYYGLTQPQAIAKLLEIAEEKKDESVQKEIPKAI